MSTILEDIQNLKARLDALFLSNYTPLSGAQKLKLLEDLGSVDLAKHRQNLIETLFYWAVPVRLDNEKAFNVAVMNAIDACTLELKHRFKDKKSWLKFFEANVSIAQNATGMKAYNPEWPADLWHNIRPAAPSRALKIIKEVLRG